MKQEEKSFKAVRPALKDFLFYFFGLIWFSSFCSFVFSLDAFN